MLHTARMHALVPGRQSMQDYIRGEISGAVTASKKLSVILKREKNTEGSDVNGRESEIVWDCQ